MVPVLAGVYDSPDIPLPLMSTHGKAVDAAVRKGIKRVVPISSVAVVQNAVAATGFLSRDLPQSGFDLRAFIGKSLSRGNALLSHPTRAEIYFCGPPTFAWEITRRTNTALSGQA